VSSIERLRALLAEATPGPWAWTETGGPFALVMGPDGDELVHVRMNLGLGSNPDRDAALIAAAVNALPLYLELEDAARSAVDAAGTENWPVNCDRLRAALEAIG
jgi:hypothetical protein